MKPFCNRKIINMTVRANNDETLRNQLPSVSKCWIAFSAVRPWIALTFWLLLIECCFFHSAAERAIMPCRKSHRRNLQKTVLRVGIILPKIRGPAQFLNTQSAQKTLIFITKGVASLYRHISRPAIIKDSSLGNGTIAPTPHGPIKALLRIGLLLCAIT